MPIPVVIDTDPGIDDALALILALRSPEFRVEAITTVAGNVGVDLASRNALMVVEVVRPTPLPVVARGAERPLQRPLVTAVHLHGGDGLGDLDRFRNPDGSPRYPAPALGLSPREGPEELLAAAGRHPGELVVICLGPLTNLALAIQRRPEHMAQVKDLFVMGGAVAVPGNVTAVAEFNMHVDPHAARTVMESGLPITLVPLDVTTKVQLPQYLIETAIVQRGGVLGQFVRDFTSRGVGLARELGREAAITLHDPLAVGVAIDPSLVTLREYHVSVEVSGQETLGMTVADRRTLPSARKAPANCRVAMEVDATRFLDLFVERICAESS